MKHRIFAVVVAIAVLLVFVSTLYAANGDLVVNGNLTVGGTVSAPTLSVGTGGVTFPDGSTQTTAKRLVWDYTVTGSAVTSVTTDNILDGNAHGGYILEVIWKSTITNSTLRMYYNSDTTNGNYYYSGTNDAIWGAVSMAYANGTVNYNGTIGLSPDGHVQSQGTYINAANAWNGGTFFHQKIATVANLTRIDWVGPSNGIGVGSRFRLWRMQ